MGQKGLSYLTIVSACGCGARASGWWAWWKPTLVGITLFSFLLTTFDRNIAFMGAVIDLAILAIVRSHDGNFRDNVRSVCGHARLCGFS